MVVLRPTNLHWINGLPDEPTDPCAHSGVEFCVEDEVLVAPSQGDWAVSASALYLLRALSQSHTKESPVCEHLFPCCGHSVYDIAGQEDVLIFGCPNGIDFEVVRAADDVLITGVDRREHRIPFGQWREAVCAFSDAVRSFYAASSPKQLVDKDEAKGFDKFMAEWSRRRSLALALS